MRVRRLCPDHVFIEAGSSLDAQLTRALAEGVVTEVCGFVVWVTHRAEEQAAHETPRVRFDLAGLTAARPD